MLIELHSYRLKAEIDMKHDNATRSNMNIGREKVLSCRKGIIRASVWIE